MYETSPELAVDPLAPAEIPLDRAQSRILFGQHGDRGIRVGHRRPPSKAEHLQSRQEELAQLYDLPMVDGKLALPDLRSQGVPEDVIDLMMREVPRRFLTGVR